MNIKEIKQILGLISEHELAEFELEREGTRLSVKKYAGVAPIPQIVHSAPELAQSSTPSEATSKNTEEVVDDGLHKITSPIVGTYYSSPSPESDAFVSVGSQVTQNDTVCIVEAMKVMNEIKAEIKGEIKQVLVENGQAVEFGQVLFKVKVK